MYFEKHSTRLSLLEVMVVDVQLGAVNLGILWFLLQACRFSCKISKSAVCVGVLPVRFGQSSPHALFRADTIYQSSPLDLSC